VSDARNPIGADLVRSLAQLVVDEALGLAPEHVIGGRRDPLTCAMRGERGPEPHRPAQRGIEPDHVAIRPVDEAGDGRGRGFAGCSQRHAGQLECAVVRNATACNAGALLLDRAIDANNDRAACTRHARLA
jgi:hypothetical protein